MMEEKEEHEIIVIETERTQILFLSDVFMVVATMGSQTP